MDTDKEKRESLTLLITRTTSKEEKKQIILLMRQMQATRIAIKRTQI